MRSVFYICLRWLLSVTDEIMFRRSKLIIILAMNGALIRVRRYK
jgi:hypothetical protein